MQPNSKFTLLQSKYYEEMQKLSEEKDEQIIQNKGIMDSLKQSLEKLKEQLYDQEIQKSKLTNF